MRNHPTSEWLSVAQGLREGASVKVLTHCASSPALRIAHEESQWKYYCFACGEAGKERKGLTLAQLAERRERATASKAMEDRPPVAMPYPQERDPLKWPRDARVWPLKAGLTYREIQDMGLYYHAPSGRVVIPVGSWYQARFINLKLTPALDGHTPPKYLSPRADPPDVFYYGKAGPVVLTEDCLSAYKVSLCGYRGWPVLGTKLTDSRLIALLQNCGGSAVVWLDPDSAGKRGAAKAAAQLEMYGCAVHRVASSKDPKLHTREEIVQLLRGAYV